MLHVAVCDDDASVRQLLQTYLNRYAKENRRSIQATLFSDGNEIKEADLSATDLLIMDIQMPGLNGLDAARSIRRTNQTLPIIFFTSYVQYALEGYEVQAFRFLLKPLDYPQFSEVVGKALEQISQRQEAFLTIQSNDEMLRIPIGEIDYAETDRGRILIHHKGKVSACRSTMQRMEETLLPHHFFRCHKAYIIALSGVRTFGISDVIMSDGAVIPISKHRKKELKEALTIFWGEQFL